jgi:TPR repeat protein
MQNQQCKPGRKIGKRSAAAFAAALAVTFAAAATAYAAPAEEIDLIEIVRNPVIGNYKGYAEFKMGHYDNARTIWTALAQRGSADASFNLGILNEDGLGVPSSMQAAIVHYETAAAAGSTRAQYRLGLLYSAGLKIAKDPVRANKWLTAAAAAGDTDAQALLAGGAANADTPRDRDFHNAEALHGSGKYQDAAAIWQRLAQQGDARARTKLAWMMETGQGMPRDLAQAGKLFRLAAEQGDADAQFALSVMLQTGQGQPQDKVQAETWRQRAAAQGHGQAKAAAAQ